MLKIENLQAKLDRLITISEFYLNKNETCFLYGSSGIGKTSLLNFISGTYKPISGQILFEGIDLTKEKHLNIYRSEKLGYIFQNFNLIEHLTVYDNILIAIKLSKSKTKKVINAFGDIQKAIKFYLKKINLINSINTKVKFLSIGQKQRIASIRAIIGNPSLILADEPTSALDEENKENFVDFLLNECKENNTALLFVSHDKTLKNHFDKSYNFKDLIQEKI